jgi:hypothetical protein
VTLERTLDALRVVGLDARGARGIDRGELGVQGGPADAHGAGLALGAETRLRGRQVRERVRRAEIEHRAAGQRNAPARVDLVDEAQRLGAETPRRVGLGGIDHVDQVVRHARALVDVRLRGPHVHAAVDLRRVDAHDLHREALGEVQGHLRLAARRGTEEKEGLHRPRRKSRSRSDIAN